MAKTAKIDLCKLADVPLTRPGFNTLEMTAPMLVNLNAGGKWESSTPEDMDEKQLKQLVNYLVQSQTVSACQSYCTQCLEESRKSGETSKFVPIIMMPILSADQCPFDVKCEQEKKEEKKKPQKKSENVNVKGAETESASKKRPFIMQRLTNFDLMSQW